MHVDYLDDSHAMVKFNLHFENITKNKSVLATKQAGLVDTHHTNFDGLGVL